MLLGPERNPFSREVGAVAGDKGREMGLEGSVPGSARGAGVSGGGRTNCSPPPKASFLVYPVEACWRRAKRRKWGGCRQNPPVQVPPLSCSFLPSSPPPVQMWINPCAQVIFDSDPAPKDTSGSAALDMMSQAMIRCGSHPLVPGA